MAENFKIFKYQIASQKVQVVEMPNAAQILDVQPQLQSDRSMTLNLWALVMPNEPAVPRRLVIIDTGEEIPAEVLETFRHIKTVQVLQPRLDDEGDVVAKSIVLHLFLEKGVVN